MIGGVVLLGLLIVAWNLVSSVLDDTVRMPVVVEYDTPQELIELARGVETGNPNAAITIVEFADYQCPSCREFFLRGKPFLDLTYIQSGQVKFVFYDFPISDIHQNAFLAARAARCAGDQNAFWPFHDRLFQTQGEWSYLADPSRTYRGYAEGLGLNGDSFSACLSSDRHADVVSANALLGVELGVQSTPTVMIDTGLGREIRLDDWSIDNIRSILDPVLMAGAEQEATGL